MSCFIFCAGIAAYILTYIPTPLLSRFEKGGKIFLTLDEGQGEVVSNLIMNQVEESQKMERS